MLGYRIHFYQQNIIIIIIIIIAGKRFKMAMDLADNIHMQYFIRSYCHRYEHYNFHNINNNPTTVESLMILVLSYIIPLSIKGRTDKLKKKIEDLVDNIISNNSGERSDSLNVCDYLFVSVNVARRRYHHQNHHQLIAIIIIIKIIKIIIMIIIITIIIIIIISDWIFLKVP